MLDKVSFQRREKALGKGEIHGGGEAMEASLKMGGERLMTVLDMGGRKEEGF